MVVSLSEGPWVVPFLSWQLPREYVCKKEKSEQCSAGGVKSKKTLLLSKKKFTTENPVAPDSE